MSWRAPPELRRRSVARLAAALVLPVAVYWAVRPLVGGDAQALLVAVLVPAAFTAVSVIRDRRLSPVDVAVLAGLSATLFGSLIAGGSPVVLKVGESWILGLIGLVLLASAAVGRPIVPTLLRRLGRPAPPGTGRAATIVIGAALVIEAGLRVAMALTLGTDAFLAIHRLVSWSVWGLGLAVLLGIRRRARPRSGI